MYDPVKHNPKCFYSSTLINKRKTIVIHIVRQFSETFSNSKRLKNKRLKIKDLSQILFCLN